MERKIATLFGGARNDRESKEYLDTIEIGKMLAEKGYTVRSGGYGGMMEAVSKGATEVGGHAIGFTCESFRSTKGNKYLTETIPSKDIYDRLRRLIMDSDVFIAQIGGIGTIAEVFLVLDIIRKLENPPKVVLVGLFWHNLMGSVQHLMTDKEKALFVVTDNYLTIENLI